jgi:hypothetical protein
MHENVPVRFGRGRLDSLGNKGLAAYLIAGHSGLGAHVDQTNGTSLRAAVSSMSCGITGKQAVFQSSNSALSP